MRLGIIGLPFVGKTTVYNLLTGAEEPIGSMVGGGHVGTETAVVDIPDSRLEALSDLLEPIKVTQAKITFVDVNGMQAGEGTIGVPGSLVNELSPMDGFLHILRAFEDPNVPHPPGPIDPSRDARDVEAEFLINDLIIVEKRLDRLEEEREKGARESGEIEREHALFSRLLDVLNGNQPLRSLSFSQEEERMLSGFGLLSKKPILLVGNLGEESPELEIDQPKGCSGVVYLKGKLELEIAQLSEEEAGFFIEEYAIEEPGRARIFRAVCEMLDQISFFTFNEEELRAWTLKSGSSALDAAATIHTDIARGFIRAEVIAWDELIQIGGMNEARTAGVLRIEGKDYRVADGEMIYIRFNI
ncbi:MAG: redox-regulated ATPase YchF [Anaerolineales bacterium]|nr:redox-regulated ATPase YchF [Anaerolineales bacterium]